MRDNLLIYIHKFTPAANFTLNSTNVVCFSLWFAFSHGSINVEKKPATFILNLPTFILKSHILRCGVTLYDFRKFDTWSQTFMNIHIGERLNRSFLDNKICNFLKTKNRIYLNIKNLPFSFVY